MAGPYYVYHGSASEAEPFDTWAKAAHSIETVDSVVGAGEEVWVASDHVESTAAAVSINFSNGTIDAPVIISSRDRSDNSYLAGGSIAATGNNDLLFYGHIYVSGLSLSAGDDLYQGGGDSRHQTFQDCTLHSNDYFTSLGYELVLTFIDCTVDLSGGISPWLSAHIEAIYKFIGCTITSSYTSGFINCTANVNIIFEGCDLSDSTALFKNMSDANNNIVFRRCGLATSYTLGATLTQGSTVTIEQCAAGAITVPPLVQYYDYRGSTIATTDAYRAGGADDGSQATAYSWNMTSLSNCIAGTLSTESPPMVRWVAKDVEIDITIYVAGAAEIYKDEFWIRIDGPDDTVTQTALGHHYTSKGVHDVLATDATGWAAGAAVGTPRKITHTYTPREDGPLTVKCFYSKPSTTVFVDPKIEVVV